AFGRLVLVFVAYAVGTRRSMNHLSIAPRFELSTDKLHGCTPWLARVLGLFSYCRCVTVNRPLSQLVVRTRHFWLWRRLRIVRFDQVSRIVFRAQAIPALGFWRYLSIGSAAAADSALFMISLALKDSDEELPLFTVWQQQPDEGDPLDREAADPVQAAEIGDEVATRVVDLLSKYIGVRVAPR
ncbi:MAG TPA: hypothetical protein VFO94_00070, partial [Gammaproteobacteria bacterium]|nr:hypothetical protein [Gammaproteobacteria bacterium]